MYRKTQIMGIVNITDNSYFSDSRCLKNGKADIDKILYTINTHIENGADIIDIGACSTRPGAVQVEEGEEWRRLSGVLPEIKKSFPGITLSIDSYRSFVIHKAYDLIGNFMVNDISSGEEDENMLKTVGRLKLDYVAMHKRGTPQTMSGLTDYGKDSEISAVTRELIKYFKNFEIVAEKHGITNWILDPGFGFAKTLDQNYQLLSELNLFDAFNRKKLVGISRKSMIFKLLNTTPEESLPATQAVHMIALQNGADILRVHDVKEASQTIKIFEKYSEIIDNLQSDTAHT